MKIAKLCKLQIFMEDKTAIFCTLHISWTVHNFNLLLQHILHVAYFCIIPNGWNTRRKVKKKRVKHEKWITQEPLEDTCSKMHRQRARLQQTGGGGWSSIHQMESMLISHHQHLALHRSSLRYDASLGNRKPLLHFHSDRSERPCQHNSH